MGRGAKISVMVPTFNEEERIKRLLDSIKKQTYKNYEIIIGDYNSTDQTVQIARRYNAIITRTKKKGVAAGRNAALKKASGDILAFIDADYILPKKLFGKIAWEFENDWKENTIAIQPTSTPYMAEIPPGRKQDMLLLSKLINTSVKISFKLSLIPIAFGCIFFRSDAIRKTGRFNDKVLVAEDIELYSRVRKKYLLDGKVFKVLDYPVRISYRRFVKEGVTKTLYTYVKEGAKAYINKKVTLYMNPVRNLNSFL